MQQFEYSDQQLPLKRRRRPNTVDYSFVPAEKRLKLVMMVEREDYRIKDASDSLNLNYSTAKSIIRLYRQTGIINRKNEKPQQTKLMEHASYAGQTKLNHHQACHNYEKGSVLRDEDLKVDARIFTFNDYSQMILRSSLPVEDYGGNEVNTVLAMKNRDPAPRQTVISKMCQSSSA